MHETDEPTKVIELLSTFQVTLTTILHTYAEIFQLRNIFEWFFNSAINANPDNCHFLSSNDMSTKISVSSFDIENTHLQKLF